MIFRLKKVAMDFSDRDFAIAYINGEVIQSNTHANCINEYLISKSIDCLNAVRRRPDINSIDGLNNPDIDEYLTNYDQEDLQIIKDNITELAFAHAVDGSNENSGNWPEDGKHIYIEQETLYNVDFNTVVNAIKKEYPDYDIYVEESNEKIAKLKKVNWLDENNQNRLFAISYINGEVYEGYTHYKCSEKYMADHNINDERNIPMAFAYMGKDNNVYIGDDFMYGYTKSDIPQIAQALKQEYPNSKILLDSTDNFDTDLNQEHKQIARLKKKAEDSTNVDPNGVNWSDTIWDTYDTNTKQKSNINREWKFEEPIDNPEWSLQQN